MTATAVSRPWVGVSTTRQRVMGLVFLGLAFSIWFFFGRPMPGDQVTIFNLTPGAAEVTVPGKVGDAEPAPAFLGDPGELRDRGRLDALDLEVAGDADGDRAGVRVRLGGREKPSDELGVLVIVAADVGTGPAEAALRLEDHGEIGDVGPAAGVHVEALK